MSSFSWFSFLSLISVSSISILAPISLLSLSLCSTSLPPSLTKTKPEHQAKPISIAVVSFFFLLCLSLWFDVRFGSGCVGYGFGILGHDQMCSGNFVDLGLWVWVHRSAFADHRRDRHGSSSWSAWIVDLISLIGVGHREGEKERQWDREGERERERDKETREREDEKK